MKTIITILTFLLLISTSYGKSIYPFGEPIRDNVGDKVVVGVSVARLNDQDRVISPVFLYTGTLHRSMNSKYVAAVVIDSFNQRTISENSNTIKELKALPMINPGKYEVFYIPYQSNDYESFDLGGFVKNKSAVIEVRDYTELPVIDPAQLVLPYYDAKDSSIMSIIKNATGKPFTIHLKDVQLFL